MEAGGASGDPGQPQSPHHLRATGVGAAEITRGQRHLPSTQPSCSPGPPGPYLLQHHFRVVVHDSEMFLVVVQVVEVKGPAGQQADRVGPGGPMGTPRSPRTRCEVRGSHPYGEEAPRTPGPAPPARPPLPVGEAQPEHVVHEQPQGRHRAQQHDVADVELDPPHVFSEEQDRTFNVLAHHLQGTDAARGGPTSPACGTAPSRPPPAWGSLLLSPLLCLKEKVPPAQVLGREHIPSLKPTGPVPGGTSARCKGCALQRPALPLGAHSLQRLPPGSRDPRPGHLPPAVRSPEVQRRGGP